MEKEITNTLDALYGLRRMQLANFNVVMPADITATEYSLLVIEAFGIPVQERRGLMTSKALCAYIGGRAWLVNEMKEMPIGGKLTYDGVLITRLSENLYNGIYMCCN